MVAIPRVRATEPTGAGSMDFIQRMCCQLVGDGFCMAAQGAGFGAFTSFCTSRFPQYGFFKAVAIGVYRQIEGVFRLTDGAGGGGGSGVHAGGCLGES